MSDYVPAEAGNRQRYLGPTVRETPGQVPAFQDYVPHPEHLKKKLVAMAKMPPAPPQGRPPSVEVRQPMGRDWMSAEETAAIEARYQQAQDVALGADQGQEGRLRFEENRRKAQEVLTAKGDKLEGHLRAKLEKIANTRWEDDPQVQRNLARLRRVYD